MVQCIPGSFYPKCHILNDLKEKYMCTQFHLTVKMKDKAIITLVCVKKNIYNMSYTTETAMSISGILLLVGLVRSL